MRRLSTYIVVATALVAGQTALAQQVGGLAAPCLTPDSIEFTGSTHRAASVLREDAGLPVGQAASSPAIQRAIKNLYATGQFDDVSSACNVVNGKTIYTFILKDRPLLSAVDVSGVEKLSIGEVRDRVDLIIGRPVDPAQVARDVSKIDSMYSAGGFYLAKVHVDTTADKEDGVKLIFRVDEGHRFAVSGVFIDGNDHVSDETIVKAIETKPEGFFWWQKGEFDDDKYAGDLAERIPQLYSSKGYIDAQILNDTMDIDRARGKALIRLRVNEGPQYQVGKFEVNGGKHFSAEEIARYYPFTRTAKGLVDVVKGVIRPPSTKTVFNQSVWDEATRSVSTAYASDGYLSVRVDPVIERSFIGHDSVPTVNLRWDITEGVPAIVNRIDIKGNDITSEACIRDQLYILPGDVFSQEKLLRSWQNISSLGFFETPLPAPDYKPTAGDQQLLDLTFNVKEKHTGNVSFGASVGQGTGLGGFIGLEQPNLFGKCKRGSLQWQFGQYINDFNLSYQDPRIQGSRISGQVTAYHSMSRFIIQDLGRTVRTGGEIRFGFPVPRSAYTRFFLEYGGEKVNYGNSGLVSTINCPNCFRSTAGMSLEHDNQAGAPFPYAGVRQSVDLQFNGGPLGGTASFQRLLTSVRANATLASFGSDAMGSQPILMTLALTVKGGAVFGDPGPFFVSQAFTLGGTQYGEQLRGYDEFSITPTGYNPNVSQTQAQRSSFGNAFYTSSAELGLRLTPQVYLDAFYDVGNIWARPSDFDPTRLFRGSGVGGAVVTPLGPLGVDIGYGFDRVDAQGHKAPKWQVHFKFGQLF